MPIDLAYIHIEAARRHMRSLIEQAQDPDREDLERALEDWPGEPIPRVIIDYIRRAYLSLAAPPRPSGRNPQKLGTLRWERGGGIRLWYRMVEAELRASEAIAEVKTRAVVETAAAFGLSVSTIYRYLRDRPPASVKQP